MKKAVGTPENRDTAFRVYARFGGKNVSAILECLEKEHGIRISMQTYYKWKREDGWEERLEGEAPPTAEEGVLLTLLGFMQKIERRFMDSPDADAQAAYAYASLAGMFFRHAKRLRPGKADVETMRRKAAEIFETEYGIKRD
jgi:hypothetical protein